MGAGISVHQSWTHGFVRRYILFSQSFRLKQGEIHEVQAEPLPIRSTGTEREKEWTARLGLSLPAAGFVPIGTNPFGNRLIRIADASKCLKKGRSLTVEQFHQLLRHKLLAKEPFRTM